ncbi:DNA methyltransferase [Sphingomonas dokdonensis]|uniref:site-specific DNA-methyltransferase (adenine-specific) n=1 Tax=Sphingomonas dokdonensis TaxID=344880 RepID=A0A245ZWH9_9SPHN|nr:DNA methyltransferase [Sphingomonas dokdonensis]OWK34094.1 DNA methylase [Sphingomonas dokdonensis]
MNAYRAFLEAKIPTAAPAGLCCDLDEVPTQLADGRPLKDHQRHIIRWAVEGGRRALFEAFGLGKSIQQLAILDIIRRKTGGDCLIVAPLGVRREFMHDAGLLGIDLRFIQSDADMAAALAGDPLDGPIFLTNYESVRDGKVDVTTFTAVSLDEASILRSFGSKTFQTFLPLFEAVPYRFVATATPSPNRYKELIHYAGFLGVMDTGQALTRFFQRNSEKAGDLTLFPHKEQEFWLWLNSWAVFLQRPSDLGFSDDGYDLPALTVRWHEAQSDLTTAATDDRGQGKLIRDAALGVVEASRERRATMPARIARAEAIVAAASADHFLIWHDLEDERRAIEATFPEVETVYGAQPLDKREGIIARFAEGMSRLLAAKPVMLGSGTNLQRHCHRAVFVGVGFKFNDFIQAIHRLQRFQQPHPVEIDIIHAETEREVVRDLQAKWARHEELSARMSEIIREYGLQHDVALGALKRSIGVERQEVTGDGWTLAHNDCVDEAARLEEGSVDLIVTSIPFSNHYEYTPSYNDFGHTDDDEHFFAQMDHLTPNLLRALAPGRLACIHVKDRILFGAVTGEGVPTVNPFHAKCIEHYMRHGFQFMGMITVVTDVVRENNQTYRLSYSEMLKDGTKMGCGSPEYVLLMRKPQSDRSRGYADTPVTKERETYSLARWQVDAHAFWRSSGERPLTVRELWEVEDRFLDMATGQIAKRFREETRDLIHSHKAHVDIGEAIADRPAGSGLGSLPRTFMAIAPGSHHPDVWDDVVRMQTLNGEQVRKGAEKHVCPLQFDIVDRLIERYSMRGELVFDPFCGLGTVPMRAILAGRRGAGSELNPDYWRHSVSYLREAESQAAIPTLFDLLDLETAGEWSPVSEGAAA